MLELLNKFYPHGYDKPYNKSILTKDPDAVNALIQHTSFLQESVSISERLYCLKHNTQPTICECGNTTQFKNQKVGFATFCSRKCMNESSITKEKRYTSTMKSQGGIGFASNKIATKIRHTNLTRYGHENPTQDKVVAAKISSSWKLVNKETLLEKRQTTNIEKYGVKYHQQNPKQKEKIKDALINNHGGIGFASNTIANKIKHTNLRRYGHENVMSNKDIQQKHKTSMKTIYGVHNISELGNDAWNHFKNTFNENTFELTMSLKEMERYYGVRYYTISKFLQQFGYTFSTISSYEQELRNLLPNEFIFNDRTILNGKELDFYSENRKLAIEFNGILFHSEKYGKDENYHNNKTNECINKDIRLIHIFEYEWLDKKDIIISMLNSKLDIFDKQYDDLLVIKNIDTLTTDSFLEENHLQGADESTIKLGLFYNDEIVSIMTFGLSKYDNYQYTLHRYCTKKHTQVIDGILRLFNHFISHNQPISIVANADRRYSGRSYEKLGFIKSHISSPKGWLFGKHIDGLVSEIDSLEGAYNEKTNESNRIWDCGEDIFVWRKDSI